MIEAGLIFFSLCLIAVVVILGWITEHREKPPPQDHKARPGLRVVK
jgi:hypothetical protein